MEPPIHVWVCDGACHCGRCDFILQLTGGTPKKSPQGYKKSSVKYMYQDQQVGGGACSLCRSPNTNKSTCPLNPGAAKPNPSKHPLAAAIMSGAPVPVAARASPKPADSQATPNPTKHPLSVRRTDTKTAKASSPQFRESGISKVQAQEVPKARQPPDIKRYIKRWVKGVEIDRFVKRVQEVNKIIDKLDVGSPNVFSLFRIEEICSGIMDGVVSLIMETDMVRNPQYINIMMISELVNRDPDSLDLLNNMLDGLLSKLGQLGETQDDDGELVLSLIEKELTDFFTINRDYFCKKFVEIFPSESWIRKQINYYNKLSLENRYIILAYGQYADIDLNKYLRTGLITRERILVPGKYYTKNGFTYTTSEPENMNSAWKTVEIKNPTKYDPDPHCPADVCIHKDFNPDSEIIYSYTMEEYAKRLNSIITMAPPLDKDIVVFRGTEGKVFPKLGMYEVKGALSTSWSSLVAQEFAKEKYLNRILVPKGSTCLWMPIFKPAFKEHEILFPHGSLYYVTDDYRRTTLVSFDDGDGMGYGYDRVRRLQMNQMIVVQSSPTAATSFTK